LANCNRKEHLRHRAVSLRQHGFLVTKTTTYAYCLCSKSARIRFSRASAVNFATHLIQFNINTYLKRRCIKLQYNRETLCNTQKLQLTPQTRLILRNFLGSIENAGLTRIQFVASIADRTASQQTI